MIESIPEQEILRDKNIKVLLVRMSVALLLGLILLFWPKMGLNLMSVIIGFFLLIQGLSSIILSLVNKKIKGLNYRKLTYRIVQLFLGIVFIVRPHWAMDLDVAINFLFVSAGVLIIAGNLIHLLLDKSEKKKDSLMQVIFIIMGLIMIFAPFFSAGIFIRLLGAITLLFSVFDMFVLLSIWKKPMS